LRPAHGATGLARDPGDEQVLDREPLRPEAAAHVRPDDAHVGWLEPEDPGQPGPVLVGRLRREPARQLAVLEDGGRGARLERARGHARAREATGDDGVAAVEE